MEQRLASATSSGDARVNAAIAEVLRRPQRESVVCRHQPPAGFRPKETVALEIASDRKLLSARLYYRHVNQAERYESVEMEAVGDGYRARIPATYTDSPYALQYYFELKAAPEKAWLYPGFAPDWTNQPYFVLRRV